MKRTRTKKLSISRETLQQLGQKELDQVAGAGKHYKTVDYTNCDSCKCLPA